MIKKHLNKNNYYFVGHGLWVRDFTKKLVEAIDINNLITAEESSVLVAHELANQAKMLQRIDTEAFTHSKIAIVADGYGFANKQAVLEQLPNDVAIIGVNDTMTQWNNRKKMDYYVINNPYADALKFIPKQPKVFPKCIASMRTFPEFIEKYKNNILYEYSPTCDKFYGGAKSEADYAIDDYRSPICAAIGLAYKFDVKKLLLFCCDYVFEDERVGSQALPNGLWQYPPQNVSHSLIDGNLFWLKSIDVQTGYYSNGADYQHATYISEADVSKFFR